MRWLPPSSVLDQASQYWEEAKLALAETDPLRKCQRVDRLWQAISEGEWVPTSPTDSAVLHCGRPERPELVAPGKLKKRSLGSVEGRQALIHAIAHIEFNAINLGLDAALRFGGMPDEFYVDWLSVAVDEARHFRMLNDRLIELGVFYGAFPAHGGLWEMAERTAHDVMIRMALVPRVLEARGLDVTPGMIERLNGAGDHETVRLLRIILEEEERHVAIGSHWFSLLCQQRGLDPDTTFATLLDEYFNGSLRGPFNLPARRRAGFSEPELERLAAMDH
ncbi:MAG: ferritin-like domain-containing protein [Pseudomonadota bacterium]